MVIPDAVQALTGAFVTQAFIDGRFARRANVLHHDTTYASIDALIAVIRRTATRRAT